MILPPPSSYMTVLTEQFGWFSVVRADITVTTEKFLINVPVGFVTDFASVPRILWDIFPPADPHYAAAAIVHDFLYSSHRVERWEADEVFYELMRAHDVGRLRAWIMWAGVRIGGHHAYQTGPERQLRSRQRYEQAMS